MFNIYIYIIIFLSLENLSLPRMSPTDRRGKVFVGTLLIWASRGKAALVKRAFHSKGNHIKIIKKFASIIVNIER